MCRPINLSRLLYLSYKFQLSLLPETLSVGIGGKLQKPRFGRSLAVKQSGCPASEHTVLASSESLIHNLASYTKYACN